MPAIASNVIVGSDDFRANRIAHLELIAEFRALERKVREAASSGSRPKAGDPVRRGQALATIGAMKMQYSTLAPIDGVIARERGRSASRRRCARCCSPWSRSEIDMEKAVVTCALTGILTNPADYPAPVTPEEMASEAKRAFDEGASVVHVHFRRQEPKLAHCPSWDPKVATAIVAAIRDACPGIIINQTTGVLGEDITGPLKCLAAVRPEIAALNAGSLNFLKTRADGTWAWPPVLFDNPVDKIRKFLQSMCAKGIEPEFECFDLGMVRTAAAIGRNYGYDRPPKYNLVMGVESGMPADPELLPYLMRFLAEGARWSVTAIGRKEIWPLHRRAAELGGDLRTGLEDTIDMPDGARAASNGDLVKELVAIAREAGRAVASPEEARVALRLSSQPKEARP